MRGRGGAVSPLPWPSPIEGEGNWWQSVLAQYLPLYARWEDDLCTALEGSSSRSSGVGPPWGRPWPVGGDSTAQESSYPCSSPAVPPGTRPVSIPPELTEAGVQARLRIPADPHVHLAATSVRPSHRSHPSHTLALDTSVEPEPSAFSLADAIAFAQQQSPRLQSARAAIERARGQEQAAFAPFLPEIDLLFQSGATSNNQGPGAPGPTGFILTSSTPGTHSYVQTELQLLWTLYDFGRRAGRYQPGGRTGADRRAPARPRRPDRAI